MRSTPFKLAVLLALLLLTAGCLTAGPGESRSPSQSPTQTDGTESRTPFGTHDAMKHPDSDKEVHLENLWNQSVTMHVQVIREATNRTVHDESYELEPDTERTVYNVSEANPDGIEEFTVVVTARNTTERVTIETNRCYGDAYAEIQEDGSLYLYHAIC